MISKYVTDEAFYFHKFMVCDRFSGQGYSKVILDWVKDFGRKQGKHYIRLDFNERRACLRDLYGRNGFQIVRVFEENDYQKLVLAECCLADSPEDPASQGA